MKVQDLDDVPPRPAVPAAAADTPPEHRVVVPMDIVPRWWRARPGALPAAGDAADPSAPRKEPS